MIHKFHNIITLPPAPSHQGRGFKNPLPSREKGGRGGLLSGTAVRHRTRHRVFVTIVFSVLYILWISIAPANCKLIIDLDNPSLSRMPIAIPDFVTNQPGPLNGHDLAEIIRNDLYLTGLFNIVDTSSLPFQTPEGDPDFEACSRAGAQAVIAGKFLINGGELIFEGRLYDVALRKMELGKRFTAKVQDHRQLAHRFGDRVMEALTGSPGCFTSRIIFVGDSPPKEVFGMDFDGRGLRQMTSTGTINMSPKWAPDSRSILFTSYLNRNPDLWSLDLDGSVLRPVSARPGINAAARFSPSGDVIALALSFNGIPNIFIITPQGQIINRLTNGRGNDISPTWSPDGATIAYVSDQAGTPQIYTIPAKGGQPKRLTFEGNYNTDPDWSPRGDLLAFTARVEGRFQICTIRPDGTDLRVLTRQGVNQEPAWSPDGRMIAFSSNRDGRRLIYLMDSRGDVQVPVSPISGKAPAWSRSAR
ncbi:MAG TPA: Tol-Pal system beta propeller repeat protein TolB [Desulfomonilaceae bacterium]|nr:Tol-Pal system beta propeller repeat protein TolB [Desulfomonilaceae bacterium]